MKKRLVALLLTTVMIVSCLAGCGQSEDGEELDVIGDDVPEDEEADDIEEEDDSDIDESEDEEAEDSEE